MGYAQLTGGWEFEHPQTPKRSFTGKLYKKFDSYEVVVRSGKIVSALSSIRNIVPEVYAELTELINGLYVAACAVKSPPKKARYYTGRIPKGYRLIGELDHQGEADGRAKGRWRLTSPYPEQKGEWFSIKLIADGRMSRKANFYLGVHKPTGRMQNNKEFRTLKEHCPLLFTAFIDAAYKLMKRTKHLREGIGLHEYHRYLVEQGTPDGEVVGKIAEHFNIDADYVRLKVTGVG